MFQGWPHGALTPHGLPVGVLFSGADRSFHSLVACCSWYRVEAVWPFPHPCPMPIAVVFVQLMFEQSCWWDFLGIASDITRWHNLTATSSPWSFGSYCLSALSSSMFLVALASKENFIGYNSLSWQLFTFRIWNTSFYALSAFGVPIGRSDGTLMCLIL